jgi:hypothetical protein
VEVVTAYLNPAQQITELRSVLARLAGPGTATGEADLGAV